MLTTSQQAPPLTPEGDLFTFTVSLEIREDDGKGTFRWDTRTRARTHTRERKLYTHVHTHTKCIHTYIYTHCMICCTSFICDTHNLIITRLFVKGFSNHLLTCVLCQFELKCTK